MDAFQITKERGGRWFGSSGTLACPVCQSEGRRDQRSLSIRDGDSRLIMYCHKSGCDGLSLLNALGVIDSDYEPPSEIVVQQRKQEAEATEQRKAAYALELWKESRPVHGSLAEVYLRERGITAALPDTLRFHPALKHGPSGQAFPAMIAAVSKRNGFAIHRTFLRPDGLAKADASPAKMMLGSVQGGSVVLQQARPSAPLVVCEGIESALSLMSLLIEEATVVATLSTSGMMSLELSEKPGFLLLAGDNDAAGIAAMAKLKERALLKGWQVSAAVPSAGDWNDELLSRKGVAA